MRYDDVLVTIGEFGCYQKCQYMLVCFGIMASIWHAMCMVFICATPEHHCDPTGSWGLMLPPAVLSLSTPHSPLHSSPLSPDGYSQTSAQRSHEPSEEHTKSPEPDKNLTPEQNLTWNGQFLSWEQKRDIMIPRGPDGDYMQCLIYNHTGSDWTQPNWTDQDVTSEPFSGALHRNDSTTQQCTSGFWFSKQYYQSTIATEWDLVCESAWMASFASSIFFFGRLIGAVVCGPLSDRFGRRPVFMVSVVLQIVCGVTVALSHNFWLFCSLFFIQGVLQLNVSLTIYVLGTELVGPSYRKFVGMSLKSVEGVGQMILTGMAYGLRNWRYIELAVSLPGLFFLLYFWLLPDSVRWLLSQGRDKEAKKIVKRAARVNGVQLSDDVLDQLQVDAPAQHKRTGSAIDLLKTWSMAKISIIVWYIWFVCGMVYYGLNLSSSTLHGNPYINYLLLAAVEIPSTLVVIPLLDRVGRRLVMLVSLVIAGAGCLGCAFVPAAFGSVSVGLGLVGKFGASAAYGTVYLTAAELFPTVLRTNGLGVASLFSRLGGLLAPQCLFMGTVYAPLPLLLFGSLSLMAGALSMLLPETSGTAMPQTLKDINDLNTRMVVVDTKDNSVKVLEENGVCEQSKTLPENQDDGNKETSKMLTDNKEVITSEI